MFGLFSIFSSFHIQYTVHINTYAFTTQEQAIIEMVQIKSNKKIHVFEKKKIKTTPGNII